MVLGFVCHIVKARDGALPLHLSRIVGFGPRWWDIYAHNRKPKELDSIVVMLQLLVPQLTNRALEGATALKMKEK